MVDSDYLCVPGSESRVVGTFQRFDRGLLVDHHSMLITSPGCARHRRAPPQTTDADIDALFGAHDLLARAAANLEGVGRHLVGSQIFDYWRDPSATASSATPTATSPTTNTSSALRRGRRRHHAVGHGPPRPS